MEIKILQVAPMGTNCYLLCDEKEKLCAIIDPGGNGKEIAAHVESMGYTACAVCLTHGHYDHTGGVAALRNKWPEIPVYINRNDQPRGDAYLEQLFPPLENTTHYGEGDTISVGSLTVEVWSTPGHSLGGVTLRCGEALFCGDTLFAGSCGRTDFHGGSMNIIMESLKRLGSLEGDWQVFPGHMENTTMERERRTNPYLIEAMRRN